MRSFLDDVTSRYVREHLTLPETANQDSKLSAAQALLKRLLYMPARLPEQKNDPLWSSTELGWGWRWPDTYWAQTLTNRGASYNGYPVSANYIGSYCLDGLAMALWALFHTQSATEASIRCVNLQGDADSSAAICGQLAGAFYGVSSLDAGLVADVQRWDRGGHIALRGVLLAVDGHARFKITPQHSSSLSP